MTNKKSITNVSAWAAQPNTPETDKQQYVAHIVQYDFEGTTYKVVVNAECPMTAIAQAHTGNNLVVVEDTRSRQLEMPEIINHLQT